MVWERREEIREKGVLEGEKEKGNVLTNKHKKNDCAQISECLYFFLFFFYKYKFSEPLC